MQRITIKTIDGELYCFNDPRKVFLSDDFVNVHINEDVIFRFPWNNVIYYEIEERADKND